MTEMINIDCVKYKQNKLVGSLPSSDLYIAEKENLR